MRKYAKGHGRQALCLLLGGILAPGGAVAAGPVATGPQVNGVMVGTSVYGARITPPAFEAVPDAGGGMVRLSPGGLGASMGLAVQLDSGALLEWDFEGYDLSASTTRHGALSSATGSGSAEVPFTLSSPIMPQGSITVDTTPSTSPVGAQAQVSLSAPGPHGTPVTILSYALSPQSPPGNWVSQVARSVTAGGRAVVAISLQGQTGQTTAYGLIYDSSGYVLTGVGATAATQVETRFEDSISGTRNTLRLGRPMTWGGGWDGNLRVGLGAAFTQRSISQGVTLQASAGATALTPISLDMVEGLDTRAVSLTVGAGARRPLGDGWAVSLSADLGAARVTGDYRRTVLVTDGLGDPAAPVGRATQGFATTAMVGQAQIGLSRVVGRGMTLSGGLFAAYQSAAPTVVTTAAAGTSATTSATGASVTGAGQQAYARGVALRPQVTTGIMFQIVYHF